MQKIAVIGAGISGLSAAHFLGNTYDVTVFEKESTPGGLIKCRNINGSLFHTCGGHVFNSKRLDVLDWFWSQFKRDVEFKKTDRNSIVFMQDGKEIPYPIENHMYLFEEQIQKHIIDSLIDIVKKENIEPQNFEDFLKGRFGDVLYSMYFRPYNEKVWHRDLKHVPLSWLEGKLPMPTVAEIIYNNINHIKEKAFVHSSFWYEQTNGSQYIADKLSRNLNIIYNIEVKNICYEYGKWRIENELFDKVVFCGNIKDIPNILKGVTLDEYIDEIKNLEYHGTTSVFCEIDKNPYSWIYLPSNEYKSHRIICTGNFSQSNNSVNIQKNRITATVEFTDEITKDDIIDSLSRMPLKPKYIDHKFNKYTYPIQDGNTRNLIKQLKKVLSDSNFYFTGRFADWEYYNMDVAIGASMDLCRNI